MFTESWLFLDTQCLFTLLLGSVSLRFSLGESLTIFISVLQVGESGMPSSKGKIIRDSHSPNPGDLMKDKLLT